MRAKNDRDENRQLVLETTSRSTDRPDERDPAAALASDEPGDHVPTLDIARERRIKALSCTEPLHELQSNRGRRSQEAYDFYDLGLAAVDAVVDRMGFDSGIARDALDQVLRTEAARYSPDAGAAELDAVVSGLVETLIRPSVREYTSAIDEVRRRFDFALLTEHENADGEIYLRATNEAINVLVGGLNTDIESAQVAAEATLEHLIRRGRLDDAARPAREARIRSIQYAAWVRQVIEETKRDVRRAGWREDVPTKLATIREHLKERMGTEERLLAAMQDARDAAARDDLRRRAAGLVETIDDCFTRHQELHATALTAIAVYVEEQDRQVFGRAAVVGAIDLTEEAFTPILAAPTGVVGGLLTSFAEALLGFGPGPSSASVVPKQPRFGLFLLALLRPPQPRELLGSEVGEPDWADPLPDPFEFTPDAWSASDDVLAGVDPPARLSSLLAAAEQAAGFDAADLLRLRALVSTAPDLDGVRPGGSPVTAAADDGRSFRTHRFAGADLLIGNLLADEAAYAARFATESHGGFPEDGPRQLPLLRSPRSIRPKRTSR